MACASAGIHAALASALRAGRARSGCGVCFDELDRYVELELAGRDADAAIPGLCAHPDGCPACREEHDHYELVSGEEAR